MKGSTPKSTQLSTSKTPTLKNETQPSTNLLAPVSRAGKHISLREVPSGKPKNDNNEREKNMHMK
jgi:hypothetical protein